MSTHLGRRHGKNYIKTNCGKMMDRRAIALVKKGSMPYIEISEAGRYAAWMLTQVNHICKKCMAHTNSYDMLSEAVLRRLKKSEVIHIKQEADQTSVKMCCNKTWALESLFKNSIGFINEKQIKAYIADAHSPNAKLCKECLEHPIAQMAFLALVEL